MFLVGYRTKLATILSWVMLVSIDSRNPLVTHGGQPALLDIEPRLQKVDGYRH